MLVRRIRFLPTKRVRFCFRIEALFFHFVVLDELISANIVNRFLLCNVLAHLIHRFDDSFVNLSLVRIASNLLKIVVLQFRGQLANQALSV